MEVIAQFPEAAELNQEQHFRANINLAWKKLDAYYTLTDNTPVYVAAVVLHPRYNIAWLRKQWSSRTAWIAHAEAELKAMWADYSQKPDIFNGDDDTITPSQSASQPQPRTTGRRHNRVLDQEPSDFAAMAGSSDEERAKERRPAATLDEQWSLYTSLNSDYHVDDPYAWWWKKRFEWPQLTRMALDILTTPPMSDEPERLFSATGLMVTDRRNRLKEDTIAASASLRSWTREGAILWAQFKPEVMLVDAMAG
ncbi:unnamed protein product [Zymoseptoria tritici ST99CH_1E4]|uniref:HAT C-terminal dimerisation domain-containing protein n=1 Tax=Zymoseptoria tritici ST99CH_1E4 TaxID=1276532 RepID=A0A2H1GGW5_ZYMTR|nr:unnamed protein product [Zymoseptoria tritici ST99CH_1E4]